MTSLKCQVEQFLVQPGPDEQIDFRSHESELMKPTEAVLGEFAARGSIVWVALAKEDAAEKDGCAIHTIAVDPSSGGEEIKAMTTAIEKLTIARDQLVRLQSLSETDAA